MVLNANSSATGSSVRRSAFRRQIRVGIVSSALLGGLLMSSVLSAAAPRLVICKGGVDDCVEPGVPLLSPVSYSPGSGLITALTPGGNVRCDAGEPDGADFRLRLDGQEYALQPFAVGDGEQQVFQYIHGDTQVGWDFFVYLAEDASEELNCAPAGSVQQLVRVSNDTSGWQTGGHLGANAQLVFGAGSVLRTRTNVTTPMFCSQAAPVGSAVGWNMEDPNGRPLTTLDLAPSGNNKQPFQLHRAVVPATIDLHASDAARCVSWRDPLSGSATPGLNVQLREVSTAPGARPTQGMLPPGGRPDPLQPGEVVRFELYIENTLTDVDRLVNVVEYFPYEALSAERFGGDLLVECIVNAPTSEVNSSCGQLREERINSGSGPSDSAAARVDLIRVARGESVYLWFDRKVREDVEPWTPVSAGVAVFVLDDAVEPTRIDDARVVFIEQVVGSS